MQNYNINIMPIFKRRAIFNLDGGDYLMREYGCERLVQFDQMEYISSESEWLKTSDVSIKEAAEKTPNILKLTKYTSGGICFALVLEFSKWLCNELIAPGIRAYVNLPNKRDEIGRHGFLKNLNYSEFLTVEINSLRDRILNFMAVQAYIKTVHYEEKETFDYRAISKENDLSILKKQESWLYAIMRSMQRSPFGAALLYGNLKGTPSHARDISFLISQQKINLDIILDQLILRDTPLMLCRYANKKIDHSKTSADAAIALASALNRYSCGETGRSRSKIPDAQKLFIVPMSMHYEEAHWGHEVCFFYIEHNRTITEVVFFDPANGVFYFNATTKKPKKLGEFFVDYLKYNYKFGEIINKIDFFWRCYVYDPRKNFHLNTLSPSHFSNDPLRAILSREVLFDPNTFIEE
jgi:hypothetical protein